MNIWIDIEVAEQVPFIKALSEELKQRGHVVIITACNSRKLKNELKQNNIEADIFGKKMSIFGLFESEFDLFRFSELHNKFKSENIKIAFSLGSRPMLVTCTSLEIPIVLFLESPNDKVDWVHYGLEKSYFIVQDTTTEQAIIRKNIYIKKIGKIENSIKVTPFNPMSTRALKEICTKIELFASYHNVKA